MGGAGSTHGEQKLAQKS